MGDFYSQMAKVAAQLLAPTSQGGLGQGVIKLTRTTPGTIDEDEPWKDPKPTVKDETLDGAVRGVDTKLIGMGVGETVILATDRQAICAVPGMTYQAGDTLSIDGKPVHVISVENIPAAGNAAAVRFLIRG